MIVDRAGYTTRKGVTLTQPVPFSHEHHVAGLGIDCRYCHTSVEKSATAGIPPTATCYNCHKLIWKDSPMLEPVRASFRTGEPIRWTRVHDLPGLRLLQPQHPRGQGGRAAPSATGASTRWRSCAASTSLQMRWCLDCHRNPEPHLRPKDRDLQHEVEGGRPGRPRRRNWPKEYHLRTTADLTSCNTCHR